MTPPLQPIPACRLILCGLASVALASAEPAPSDARWWAPDAGRIFPAELTYANESGALTTLNVQGPTDTAGHPFFTALGTNGRACVTCHQPADGMSLSLGTIQARWRATQGRDPLFAAIDGSDCPSLPQGRESSHSLLLTRGLIRVFRPWPPVGPDGTAITPEFDVEVLRDPTGCNRDPVYGLSSPRPMISVYRRPRPTANLKFVTAAGFPFEPKDGLPLPRDPVTGDLLSGNLMADGRAATLRDQAIDALRTHLEVSALPDERQLQRIIDFEKGLYSAQSHDHRAGSLTDGGARGGPWSLAQARPGVLNSATRFPMWDEFESWLGLLETGGGADPQTEFRRSVARGVRLFRDRTFLISDNAGITSMTFGNPVRNDCNFCHNMYRFGNDVAPGQVDLGTTNEPFADPAPDLPLFRLTCRPGFRAHPHLGRVVLTSDPGYALTTGRCRDIGKITIQSMRGLAARAPFFASGSARTIRAIVDYYERRYRMGLTEQEKQDLTNLMSVL